MRSTLYTTLLPIAVFISIAFIGYLLREVKKLREKLNKAKAEIKNLEAELKSYQDSPNLCGNYTGSIEDNNLDGLISSEIVNQMIEEYLVSEDNSTRSVNFDLESLKKFIFYSEKKIIEYCADPSNNIDQVPTLGMRFYFAAYSSNEHSPCYPSSDSQPYDGYNIDCSGRKTLVMVPTYLSNHENQHGAKSIVDFDLTATDFGLDMSASYQGPSIQVAALNKGMLFPPMN